uniref:t-SNARE coiled-coil homology domain-containing protein n=1 Tax=Eutreptiella gymnastica TaxID=73025 RepID=A0A7S1JHS6_9EUGL|mmetsp:Transcript_9759/g.17199  ORF Transcript_9759/g.17199 Transcript_9759/m.17199 type:complete len:224 (+) Transcript_9759:2-673(+)
MTDLFDSYAQDYEESSGNVNTQVAQLGSLRGEKKKSQMKKIAKELDAMRTLLKNLDSELLTAPQHLKMKLRTRISNYRSDFLAIEREFNNASQVGINMDRDELLRGRTAEEISSDERTRLLASTNRLDRGSQAISSSRRIAAECEDLGNDIMTNLGKQRDTIERATNMVRETTAETTRASRGITIMQRRTVTNKLILAVIIICLLFAMAIIIWFKWLQPLLKK